MWEMDHKECWAQKNWCFQIVTYEKMLENPTDCKIKPVNPKGINSEYSLEWLMLKRKLWCFGPLMHRASGKDPGAGKDWGQEEKGLAKNVMAKYYHWSMDMNLSKLQEIVKDREAWHVAVHEVTKCQTWLHDWTTTTIYNQTVAYHSLILSTNI